MVLFVSWNKPDGGDDINRYLVRWYKYGGTFQFVGHKYVDHIREKITYIVNITNLQSGIKYQVQVRAENFEGYGPFREVDSKTGTYC